MISKKSRKVVAALLIGATICASGTFAYFNARTDLKNIEGLDKDAQKTLNITNGKIVIKGKMAGSEAGDLSALWGYDVARVSTIESIKAGTTTGFGKEITTAFATLTTDNIITGGYKLGYFDQAENADRVNYVDVNRSPDILGLADVENAMEAALNDVVAKANAANPAGNYSKSDLEIIRAYVKDKDYNTAGSADKALIDALKAYDAAGTRTDRAKVGTGVTGTIINARPGDAFALGAVGSVTIDKAGIEIDNQSNLTTKIGIRLNSKEMDKVKAQLNSMNANGWKVYIKVTGVTNDKNPFKEWKEINAASFGGDDVDNSLVCSVATVKPGEAAPKLQMRVELPLDTTNAYQELATGDNLSGDNGTNEFDIANMFEIVATQENNPGWNEDGSTTNPLTDPTATVTPNPYK